MAAVALTLWAWLGEAPREGPPADAPAFPPLLAAAREDVGGVEVSDASSALVARRAGDRWIDAQGRPWRTDVVETFLDTLRDLRPVRSLPPTETERFGLGQGRIRVFDIQGGILLDLQLGDTNPAMTGLYARRADQPEVLLVGGLLSWELKKLRATTP